MFPKFYKSESTTLVLFISAYCFKMLYFNSNKFAGFKSFAGLMTNQYEGHSRISDTDLIKRIRCHFCASHIPTNKLQLMCFSELLSNHCHDATSMVARQQKIAR